MAKPPIRGAQRGKNTFPPSGPGSEDTATIDRPDAGWDTVQVPRGPRTDEQQRKALRALGIKAGIYERLWNDEDELRQFWWTRQPKWIIDVAAQRDKVFRFLLSVKLARAVFKGLEKRGKFVHGEARGSVRDPRTGGKPEKPGLLRRANAVVDDVIGAIDRFMVVADELQLPAPKEGQPPPPEEAQPHGLAMHDRRISRARPLLETAREILTHEAVEVDPRLRGRVQGNPGGPKLHWPPGGAARPFKWTKVKRLLAHEVQPLVFTRTEASRLASDLLTAVYPKPQHRHRD